MKNNNVFQIQIKILLSCCSKLTLNYLTTSLAVFDSSLARVFFYTCDLFLLNTELVKVVLTLDIKKLNNLQKNFINIRVF